MGKGDLVLVLLMTFVRGLLASPSFPPPRFHVPWAVSVMYANGDLIGAGSIIQLDKVLVSVDNLNQVVAGSDPPVWYYKSIDNINVNAGTNYVEPTRLEKTPTSAQTRKVADLYVAVNTDPWTTRKNPKDLKGSVGVKYDAYGLAFGVGMLVLRNPFSASAYVMPMLLQGPTIGINGRVTRFLNDMGNTRSLREQTCMTYSWNQQLNRIRYHLVTYQNTKSCLRVYCHYDLAKCFTFPKKWYHVCYKSVWYVDVCPNARGAALYCEGFNNTVLGILTTAPSCGRGHLPGVYATVSSVIQFYEQALSAFPWNHLTKYNLYALQQNNND